MGEGVVEADSFLKQKIISLPVKVHIVSDTGRYTT